MSVRQPRNLREIQRSFAALDAPSGGGGGGGAVLRFTNVNIVSNQSSVDASFGDLIVVTNTQSNVTVNLPEIRPDVDPIGKMVAVKTLTVRRVIVKANSIDNFDEGGVKNVTINSDINNRRAVWFVPVTESMWVMVARFDTLP